MTTSLLGVTVAINLFKLPFELRNSLCSATQPHLEKIVIHKDPIIGFELTLFGN